MIVWELGWADSALVVLDEWQSYTGVRISRFGCTKKCFSLLVNNMTLSSNNLSRLRKNLL